MPKIVPFPTEKMSGITGMHTKIHVIAIYLLYPNCQRRILILNVDLKKTLKSKKWRKRGKYSGDPYKNINKNLHYSKTDNFFETLENIDIQIYMSKKSCQAYVYKLSK